MTEEEFKEQEKKKIEEELKDQKKKKDIEFYAASVAAWYNSSLEHDKSLLTLSAGGIGLLLTLLTTVGLGSAESLVLYIGAIISFVVSLVSILWVFSQNRTHIEDIFSDKNTDNDPLLFKLDKIAIIAFGLGVIFTAIIGISAAFQSYISKEKNMVNEVKKTLESSANQSFETSANQSFNGMYKLQSSVDCTRSFNGASKLQPKSGPSSADSSTTTTTTTTTSSSETNGNAGTQTQSEPKD